MLSVLAALLVIICLSGVFLLLRKPHYTIVVLMLSFLIEQALQSYFPTLAGGYGWVTNVAIGTLALVAVANRYMQGRVVTSGYWNAAFVCVVLLYLYSWLNAIPSPARDNALAMNLSGWPYWVLLVGIAPLLLGDIAEFRRVVIAFMIVGILFTLLLSVNPVASFEAAGRFRVELAATGKHSNPLALGTAGGMLLICSVLFRPERMNFWLLIVRIAAFTLGFGLAVASGSRGQVLVAVAVCVLMFPVAYPVRSIVQFFAVATGLMIVIGGVIMVFDAVTSDLGIGRWESENMAVAMSDRFANALVLTEAYMSSPGSWLVGLGSNAFTALAGQDTGYVHNIYVEICTEQGLVGTVLLAIVLVTLFKGSRRMLQIYKYDLAMRPAVATLIGITLLALGLGLKQGSLLGSAGMFFWVVMLAKVATHESRMAEADEQAWLEEQAWLDEQGYFDEDADGWLLEQPA